MPELGYVFIEIGCHPGHLRFRQGVHTELLHQFIHPTGRDAGEVAVRDHGDQRGLGSFPAFEEPFREVAVLPQLRDGDIDRPGTVSLVSAADQTTEAFAASQPIAVREKLTQDKLHRVKVRLGDVEQYYLTPESGMAEGMVAVQRIGKDQLVPRESLGQPDALERKPVAVTNDEEPPPQTVAGSRVGGRLSAPNGPRS